MKQSVGLPNDLAWQMIYINLMYIHVFTSTCMRKVEFSSSNMFNQISEAEACRVAPCL